MISFKTLQDAALPFTRHLLAQTTCFGSVSKTDMWATTALLTSSDSCSFPAGPEGGSGRDDSSSLCGEVVVLVAVVVTTQTARLAFQCAHSLQRSTLLSCVLLHSLL